MTVILTFILGLWIGTGWVWFKGERGMQPLGLRIYRAVTWLPCTVLPSWAWFWRRIDRRWYR